MVDKQDTVGSQWQVMLANGRVIGPFSTSAVLKMLSDNRLSGEEKIRKVGQAQSWIPFSKSIEFYDKLMEIALHDSRPAPDKSALLMATQETIIQRPQFTEASDESQDQMHGDSTQPGESTDQSEDLEKTSLAGADEGTHAVTVVASQVPSSIINAPVEIQVQKVKPRVTPGARIEISKNTGEVVELNRVADIEKEIGPPNPRKKMIGALLAASGILLAYLSLEFFDTRQGDFRLLRPRYGKGASLPEADIEKALQQGFFFIQKDSLEYYKEAQSLLVKVLEAQSHNSQARAWLCLTQRELWPFVTQDSIDQETFLNLVKSTKGMDSVGESGAVCEISRLLADGKVNEARGVVDYYLAQPKYSINPIFVAVKGEILGRSLDYVNATMFLDTAQKIIPNWAKLYSLKGQYELLDGQVEAALVSFSDAIKINPKHKQAYFNKGIIEYRFLKNLDLALDSLLTGVNLGSRTLRVTEVKAYQTLAQIYKEKREFDKAKKFIERAFLMQPGDSEIRALYAELGGDADVTKGNFKQNELVYLGDQYVNLGDCLAAQAEYKAAFEIDPRNAVAAMKAARCLWELAQPFEAIDWLKKAIAADPKLIEASVLLADYYSQRYDFSSAVEALASSAKRNPNNAEVLRGYGIIEYRRNNLKAALGYLKRSLKLFDNDENTLILLARANAGLGNFDEAQNLAIRALELDPTNADAMVVYGKNLAQHKGASAGINYLNGQIKKFSYTLELRLALAEVYLELERYSEAERIYGQVVDYNPKSKRGWIGLGKSYQAQLRYMEGIKAYIEASILDVSDAEPLFLLGRLYIDLNQIEKSLVHFEKAIKVNPNYPNVYYHSGRAALLKGDLKLALEYANKERQKNPNIAESYLLAAEIYDINQEYQMCSAEYQKALKLRPQGSEIYIKMARCYRLAGSGDIAENMLNIAASIESGNPDIYKEQGAIFESRMDYRAAVVAFEKYLMLSPNARDKLLIEQKIIQLQK